MNAGKDTFGRITSVLVIIVVLLLEFQLKVVTPTIQVCSGNFNHWNGH